MSQKMTPQQRRDYLASGGGQCPFCKGGDIESDENPQMDGASGAADAHCNDCGECWIDVVSLTDVLNADASTVPDDPPEAG